VRITVVYARSFRQELVELDMEPGATAGAAAAASGLGGPDAALGISGKPVQRGRALQERDRVEILSPLTTDPNEARRRRAKRR